MSVELFITNLDFLTKLQAVFNLDDFILNFNATQINVQGGIFFSKLINMHALLFGTLEYISIKFPLPKQSENLTMCY